MPENLSNITYRIEIQGLVQGVGFRPFIYRIAIKNKLKGSVENRNDGVIVLLNSTEKQVKEFINEVYKHAPPASNIASVNVQETEKMEFNDFKIVISKSVSDSVTDISPDIAVCEECLKDMKSQNNRLDYPFINCTNCGPRFTIIKSLPYDREKTTMKKFAMCKKCNSEYTDVMDRRFHAQPVACAVCGPEYKLYLEGKEISDQRLILEKTVELLENKGIVAIKGLGGFFIACNAFCEDSVARLRNIKSREGKPFAVMCSDIIQAKQIAYINKAEEESLKSLKRPIVLLNDKAKLASSVNVGFDTVGVMLPYMPFHYLIFENSDLKVIVLTSGNISDEPIITDNAKAVEILGQFCDAVLTYNRDIYNRADDSVVNIVNDKERLIRRSRGYAPAPISLIVDAEGVLANGAELVNCFCIGKAKQAILSQHIGDLKNLETYEFYKETISKYKSLFRFSPNLMVTDLHPDYLSTRYAEEYNIPVIRVQHHHAHIASCMAEHGLDESVIGVAMDGTGLGSDGNIWGSEFLICNLKDYKRVSHFEYMPLPGGDMVTHEPWRMAVSYLYKTFGMSFLDYNLTFLKHIPGEKIRMLCKAIDENINSPLSSGAGRLFDAVSALTGLCINSSFHAEAPMRLESAIKSNVAEYYPFESGKAISFKPLINEIVKDLADNVDISIISARFHNAVIEAIIQTIDKISDDFNIKKVVLSGGSFQNRYILKNLEDKLSGKSYKVYSHEKIPTNDAGIALGQLLIGAATRL